MRVKQTVNQNVCKKKDIYSYCKNDMKNSLKLFFLSFYINNEKTNVDSGIST